VGALVYKLSGQGKFSHWNTVNRPSQSLANLGKVTMPMPMPTTLKSTVSVGRALSTA